MNIAIGSDHRGVDLKEVVKNYLLEKGHTVTDMGTNSRDSVDYPIFGEKVGQAVANGVSELGIVICGTGYGISLAAQAVRGIRAVCCSDVYTAEYTRRHNNANVLAMGAEVVGEGLACKLAETFISSKFDGGRHIRRLAMLPEITRRNCHVTGKFIDVHLDGRILRVYNQRSLEWTYPYEYAPNPGGTLKSSGCGVFSLCEAVEFMSDKRIDPEEMADFSVRVGGRGDDGTDRPKLLQGVVDNGLEAEYGLKYNSDGNINDYGALWSCLENGGCALCNLRPGHIVTLLGCRVAGNEKQVLAMDCHSESADARVKDSVREVITESKITWTETNASGTPVGRCSAYALFWVTLETARNFTLMHKI